MKSYPIWAVDGKDWPNFAASQFIEAGGLVWHVQVMGQGPVLLMIHGTGAASHSWRDVAPSLARHFTLIVPDLPGHGFTSRDPAQPLTLPHMAACLSRLVSVLGLGSPDFVVGHSAGAAVAARMCADEMIKPRVLISLNGAFKPFTGIASYLYPALAKLLFLNSLAPTLIARKAANPVAVARVIRSTGSILDQRGIDLYVRLLRTRRHVSAALGMMANWDLRPLERDLSLLTCSLVLVAAEGDLAVPPSVAQATKCHAPTSRVISIPQLGHLAHEEQPALFADLIVKTCV